MVKQNFLGGNSIRILLLSACFYCKAYCSRDQQIQSADPLQTWLATAVTVMNQLKFSVEISITFPKSVEEASGMYLWRSDLHSNDPVSPLWIFCLCLQFWTGVHTDHLCWNQVAILPEPEMRTSFNNDTTQLNLDLRATDFSGTARDLWNEQLHKSSQKSEKVKGKTQRYLPEIHQPPVPLLWYETRILTSANFLLCS